MNKNEFYKQLMSEYTFDAEKIRENAKRGAKRQKLQPMYIGMTAAAAACVVTVGTIAAVNLGGRGGVTIQDSGLTQLSASDRLTQALEQLELERGSTESKDFLVTFSAPMSPAEARAVLTEFTEGSVPVKMLYLADGSRISDVKEIESVFSGGSAQITGAAVYCSGDTAAKLQSDPAVFLVETMQQSDFDNASPVNPEEVNTEEIVIPAQPDVSDPITNTAPVTPDKDGAASTAEPSDNGATSESDGTVEIPSSTEEMDGTAEPEFTEESATDDSDPVTAEAPDPDNEPGLNGAPTSEVAAPEVTVPPAEVTTPADVPTAEVTAPGSTTEPSDTSTPADTTINTEPVTTPEENVPAEDTSVPEETVPTDEAVIPDETITPAEPQLPAGVTLPTEVMAETHNTYISGDNAFFLTDNVMYVRNGSYIELYKYSDRREEHLCSEYLEEPKVVWVAENGGKMMLTGMSDYGTRGRTLFVDAENETITDLHTEDSVMSGVLSSASYNAESGLLTLNIREDGMYYISVLAVDNSGSCDYIGTPFKSETKISTVAMNGSTLYLLNSSGGAAALTAVDVYSGSQRTVTSFSEIPEMNRNYAFTHAVFTLSDGSVKIFDPQTEKLISLDSPDGSITFGASRHSFINGGVCYTVSNGSISANGGISAMAAVEYKRSFSAKYAASVSGGMVRISASSYNSLNRSSMLTFSEISDSASAELRNITNGAIGLNNALALSTLRENGMNKPETVSESLSVYYSAAAEKTLLARCDIAEYGALHYTNGGLTAINARDTALVISSENSSTASGVLYVKAGVFSGRTAYRSVNVKFVKENGFWKLDSLLS